MTQITFFSCSKAPNGLLYATGMARVFTVLSGQDSSSPAIFPSLPLPKPHGNPAVPEISKSFHHFKALAPFPKCPFLLWAPSFTSFKSSLKFHPLREDCLHLTLNYSPDLNTLDSSVFYSIFCLFFPIVPIIFTDMLVSSLPFLVCQHQRYLPIYSLPATVNDIQ